MRPETGAVAFLNSEIKGISTVELMTNRGQTFSWKGLQIQKMRSLAILKTLVKAATDSEGVMVPVCSRQSLKAAIDEFGDNLQQTIKVADFLNRRGRKHEARQYLQVAAASDDTNVKLQYLLAGLKTQDGFEDLAGPGQEIFSDLPAPSQVGDGNSPALAINEDPLANVQQQLSLIHI